jgi:hypothetical protein
MAAELAAKTFVRNIPALWRECLVADIDVKDG